MIFSLDEEIHRLSLDDNKNDIKADYPIAIYDDIVHDQYGSAITYGGNIDHLSVHPNAIPLNGTGPTHTMRRRSSAYSKFPILTPPNTRKFSITGIDATPNGLNRLSTTPQNMNSSNISENGLSRNLCDFKPVRVLGQGAYGKVILVKDTNTSKLYAMKQLQKAEILISPTVADSKKEEEENNSSDDNDTDNGLSKRLERTFAERSILSEIEHPNIVKLFYSFHDNSKLYLLLQYIPGGELFYHLKEHGTLDETTVSFYAAEISCALKFLHSKGVVYRDLKPENCLLNQRGHLVLTDFGLSKKSAHDSMADEEDPENVKALYSIIGTPEYCAPEILLGKAYTQNCDWYSLGCLLYDMLVGKPPYTGNNHKVIINKIQQNKQGPKIPFYLSEGMKDILNALLKRETSKRWNVDKYWAKIGGNNKTIKSKKKKSGNVRTSFFTEHFIFRKIDWKLLQSGQMQKTTLGPIVPVITDLELAENFDAEFTSMSYEENYADSRPININSVSKSPDMFKGFSYKASGSYLEKYF
ncbi:YBR028C-like protein [Saccharomyces cerevisiae x Saccharomyces kudriavzevii VIN7]|uniref:YBR028C-like protein n=1 Tax=Saccharomyces cerevisiae x Saccharomyces kudriavzevii (strain VIN7) TaxID=1095631 RepID=H0GR59_SACCK|nr:YBR028C-like protein [Saccharomyces cerevisiae x Saccharomyces kudriavzevii VIN7]